jgi:hypothetical protein
VGFARDVLKFSPAAARLRVLDPNVRQGASHCLRGLGKTEIAAVALTAPETAGKAGEMLRRAP